MGQPLCNEEKNNAQFVFYRIITHQLQYFPSMGKFLLPMTLNCLPLTKEIYQSARSVLSKIPSDVPSKQKKTLREKIFNCIIMILRNQAGFMMKRAQIEAKVDEKSFRAGA